MKIKVCGITDVQNMLEVARCGPDFMGFIFYRRSLRFVGEKPDKRLFSDVPDGIEKVAVLVNEHLEQIVRLTHEYGINAVQLHGMESPGICRALRDRGLKVIKVISADKISDWDLIGEYLPVSDYLLFDTPTKKHGGSGRKFDWDQLEYIPAGKKFFLSGGVAPDDCSRIKKMDQTDLFGVDVNSRFEIIPGIKDVNIVSEFIKCMRDE